MAMLQTKFFKRPILKEWRLFIPLEIVSPRSSGLAPVARARLLTGFIDSGDALRERGLTKDKKKPGDNHGGSSRKFKKA